LTIPGLDVRLAFGRVRDDVLKTTGSRQEPFVYGSLGGGNVSLVPAPAAPSVSANDVKTDYDLVSNIGTKRGWEVFLAQHPTGFYAELAKAQIERIGGQPGAAAPTITMASPLQGLDRALDLHNAPGPWRRNAGILFAIAVSLPQKRAPALSDHSGFPER
jgi:hypothetical protein